MNEIIILYSDATSMVERVEVEKSKFSPLTDAKQTFSYMMLESGVWASREHSHWCMACRAARGRGEGTTNFNFYSLLVALSAMPPKADGRSRRFNAETLLG